MLSGSRLDDTNFLFSTSKGMLHFDLDTKKFTPVLKDRIKYSRAIFKTNNSELIIGRAFGIATIDYAKVNGQYTFQLNQVNLTEYRPTNVGVDDLGNLWIGTLGNGVVKINNYKNLLSEQKAENSIAIKKFDLRSGTLRASYVYFSKNSGAWIGTFNKGLYQFELEENPFKHYSTEMDLPNGLTSNRILSISPFDDESVVVNANRGGIGLFNTKSQNLSH